MPDGNTSFGSF